MAALGPAVPRAVPGDVRLRALRRAHRRAGSRPGPARHQAALLPASRRRRCVFASELKALSPASRRRAARSTRQRWSPPCCTTGCPTALRDPGASRSCSPGTWAEFRPDGGMSVAHVLGHREVAAAAAAGPPVDLGAVIEESVAAHLVADVPVSTFLCGGLDSSIITVLASAHTAGHRRVHDPFRPEDNRLEAMPDDARLRPEGGAEFGIKLHEIEIAPDVADLLPRMVDILDEPIGDPAAINTLLICEAARAAGVKVLLSGMGADELFGGYRKHLACLLAARYRRVPEPSTQAGHRACGRPVAGDRRRARPPTGAVGQALHDLRRPARGGRLPPELHALRRAASSST